MFITRKEDVKAIVSEYKFQDQDHTVETGIIAGFLMYKLLEGEILRETIEVSVDVEDLIVIEIHQDRYQDQESLDVVTAG